MASRPVSLIATRSATFMLKVFCNLHRKIHRLYDDRDFCDLTVVIGEDTFECHRLILAAASDFFRASLASSWSESSSRVVRLDHCDVTADSFRLLLDILYNGVDVVTMTTATDILKMAIFLQINFLQEDIEEYLLDNMDPDTCLGIWQFADKYNLEKLAEKAADLAVAQFEKVIESEEYLYLPKALLLIVMSLVTKVSMDSLFRAVIRWTEADLDSRAVHLSEFLPFISFPHFTPEFLGRDVVPHLSNTLKEVLRDYIEEALTFYLCGKMVNNKKVQLEALAKQHRLIRSPEMSEEVVLAGGIWENKTHVPSLSSFPADSLSKLCTNLRRPAPLPGGFDTEFATCLWRNELYVSGGSAQPRMFAVYRTGVGQWDTLLDLPQGRERHSMAAVNWNIYVIGGVEEKGVTAGKVPASDVAVYNCKTNSWRVGAELALAVEETTAAVLGHRIYIFGGKNASDNTDIVQCVDTLTDCVYTAGRLPAPARGPRALSNGGAIYVATTYGQVLKLKENYVLADERERLIHSASKSTCTSPDGSAADLEPTEHSDGTSNGKVNTCETSATAGFEDSVSFETVGKFPAREHFGAYLYGGELVVCGGETLDGSLHHDQVGVNLKTGKVSHKEQTLIKGRARFDVHVMNVPSAALSGCETVNEGTVRLSFLPSPVSTWRSLASRKVTIGASDWEIRVTRKNESACISLHWKSAKRNEKVKTECKMQMLSVNAEASQPSVISEEHEHAFVESESGSGFPVCVSLDMLTCENSPYLHDGKVLLEAEIIPGKVTDVKDT